MIEYRLGRESNRSTAGACSRFGSPTSCGDQFATLAARTAHGSARFVTFKQAMRPADRKRAHACARPSNLDKILTTKIGSCIFFNHVIRRARRGGRPGGGEGHEARRGPHCW